MNASRLRVGQLFALSILLLVVFAVVGFFAGTSALNSQRDNRRRLVDRIDPALIAGQRFLGAMVDEETGIRGYALGGNEVLLDPYTSGRRAAPRQLSVVRRLADRGSEVDAIDAAAGRWEREYAQPTIRDVRSGRTTFTTSQVLAGKNRFDAIRGAVSALSDSLNVERGRARSELTDSSRRMRAIFIAVLAAIAVAILLVAFMLRRFVVSPMGALAGDVRQVAQGDFERSVRAGGAREIVGLGEDVEAMRRRIVTERDDLARSNSELEQFAYVASHDLQEPLRKVASFTQMLAKRYEGQLDERADQYIGFAVDGARRMQDLINDLLAFSRVGRMSEAFTTVNLDRVAAGALADLATDGATVEIGELPRVHGEPRLLEAVFANLISNGIKFRGEDPPVIRVAAQHRDGEWCFTVADNGIGIEPEYADRIFVIFQRLHPRSAYDGTGIGLSLCRKIVEYHGGRIWLDTEVEQGSTFHFTLPEVPS